jgi:acyl carrier protein
MEIDTLKRKIRTFLIANFPLARSMGDEDALLGNGVLDSLGILEVVTFVEREFGITIVDDELLPENFQSISRLATFLQTKLNNSLGAL